MKFVLSGICALLLLAGCATPSRWVEDAKWYEANMYFDKADKLYQKAAAKEPENAEYYYLIGRNKHRQTVQLTLRQNRFRTFDTDADGPMTVNNDSLRVVKQQIQDCHNAAIQNFLKALELKPDLYEAFYPLADSYYATGQFDMAIYYFDQVSRQEPDNVQAFYFLGLCYEAKGEKSKAMEYFKHAADMGSRMAQQKLNG